MQRIAAIIHKEYLLDLRQKHLVFALILYVLCNSYIAYKAFNVLPKVTWNATFLLIFLFVGLNTILKSFGNRYEQRQLFYYSQYHPTELYLAKLIYNFVLLLSLSLGLAFSLAIFSGIDIPRLGLFILSLSLGCLGASIMFSFVSLISVKANTNSTVFSVLALPLVLPFLLLMLKINAVALGLILMDTDVSTDILIFVAIILLFFSLSLIMFPILWKS